VSATERMFFSNIVAGTDAFVLQGGLYRVVP
jgi:hypothetical protein